MPDETGPISHDEAREMLSRFNASHWRNGRERARYTIPCDPRRDDDVRMAAYIDQQRERDEELARLRASVANGRPPEGHVRLPDGRDVRVSTLGINVLEDIARGSTQYATWMSPDEKIYKGT